MKISITIILCIVLGNISAQYIYFDQTHILGESYRSVLASDSNYITFGVSYSMGGVTRRYDLEGQILDQSYTQSSVAGYYGWVDFAMSDDSQEESFYISGWGDIGNGTGIFGVLYKLNSNLDTVWSDNYKQQNLTNTSFSDILFDDKLIVLEFSEDHSVFPFSSGTSIIAYNSDGEVVWNKPLKQYVPGFNYRETAIDKIIDGYVIGGFLYYLPEVGVSDWVPTVTKTDAEGNVMWEFVGDYVGNSFYSSNPQVLGHSNGFVYSFNSDGTSFVDTVLLGDYYNTKLVMRKFDADSGDIILESELLSDEFHIISAPMGIIESDDGGILVLGHAYRYVPEESILLQSYSWLLKLDEDGEVIWYREYEHAFDDGYVFMNLLRDLASTPDGGYIMAGNVELEGDMGGRRSWLVKVDHCGDVVWDGCAPVGIAEIDKTNTLKVWPNPTQDFIQLSNTESTPIEFVLITDLYGKMVYSKAVYTSSEIQIDISDLASGVYIAQTINIDGEAEREKFVVE